LIFHILSRNGLLRHVIEGKTEGMIEVTRKRGRGTRQVLNGLKEKRGHWKLETGGLDGALWRTGFGIGCGSVVRQSRE
jgi:hypothetical protein